MKTRTSIYHRTFAFAYVLLVAVIFCGCGNGEYTIDGEIEYRTVEVDGCEYVTKYNGYQRGYMFSHKGNCKFCAERSKK
jgi:hypothetical protein